jgi:zinc protease
MILPNAARFPRTAFLLFILLALGLGVAQSAELQPEAAVRFGTLDNGVRYAVMANHVPQSRASLRLGVTVGSLDETGEERGVAHFLEHLAFNGSRNFPPGTLVEYFQRLGMGFGTDSNASTNYDRTIYQLDLPDTRPQTVAQAFTVFEDFADRLLLMRESVEKERDIILSEARTRDSKGQRTYHDEMSFLMPDALVSQRHPIGLKEIISTVSRERIKEFYDAWYRPENLVVVAVGDFDPAAVEKQLKEGFASLQARSPARKKTDLGKLTPIANTTVRLYPDPEASTVSISIETVAPYAHQPDTLERRKQDLVREVTIAMLNRRLAMLAQQPGAPFIGARASVDEQFDFYRTTSIGAGANPAQWRAALAVIEQELRRALEHGFAKTELDETVRIYRNLIEQASAMTPTLDSRAIAGRLTDSMIDRAVFTLPTTEEAFLKPMLERITPQECLDALRAVWNAQAARHIYVAGNLTLDEPEKQILAAYDASHATPVTAWKWQAEGTFAYTDFGPPGPVAGTQKIDDLDVTLVQFKNGVRLNLKHTDFEAGSIHVSIRVGSGKLTEPRDRPGLADMAVDIMGDGGLGRHSAEELRRLLAGKTVGMRFDVDEDALSLGGSTRQADLLLQLQVLCALVTDPGYRPEALRRYRENAERFYAGLTHDVGGPMRTDASLFLANGDPRFGVPDKAVVLNRTMDEVRAWLTPQFAEGPVEIAIVGDLDIKAAIAAVARTFGALPERAARPAYAAERKVAYPAPPASRSYTVQTTIPRGIAQVVWAATDGMDIDRERRLGLLAVVLQDRLRVRLREELGATYSPNARTNLSDTYPGYGFIRASASVAPERAQAVIQAIKAVGDELAEHGVTADELTRAKAPAMTSLRESLRSNGYWLRLLASVQEQPQRADWARTRVAAFDAITVQDLNAAAVQYLKPERAFDFISLPRQSAAGATGR